jgi:hypothetical protein
MITRRMLIGGALGGEVLLAVATEMELAAGWPVSRWTLMVWPAITLTLTIAIIYGAGAVRVYEQREQQDHELAMRLAARARGPRC